jgi:predicted DsbA family dithiol-disulfide isomerase
MAESIKVDVWSDVVCPWCYIGKRRLEAGAAAYAERRGDAKPVEVEFHSFELSPDLPVDFDGSSVDFLVRHKRIPEGRVREMHERVAGIAASVGLAYDFEAVRPTNTVKAHQLLHLAKAHGVQPEMKERLLSAHFVEGRHVGRDDELAELAHEVGLDREEVIRSLKDEDFLPAVRADQRLAAQLGIRGVPFFVFQGKYAISGAQPSDVFTEALTQAQEDERSGERV